MKPGNNSLGKRRARKIAIAVIAVLIVGLLALGVWHSEQRAAQAAPALDRRREPDA